MNKYFNDSVAKLIQPRILIGDGQKECQNAYLKYFESLSCEYNIVSSGAGVVKNYNNFPYDAIILGQSFSDMPVLEVCRQIRAMAFDQFSPIPIVILQISVSLADKAPQKPLLTAEEINELRVFVLHLDGMPDFKTFCRLINQVLPDSRAKLLVDGNGNDDNKGRKLSC